MFEPSSAPASAAPVPATAIRPGRPADREGLCALLSRDDVFNPVERRCALELIDGALADPSRGGDYRMLVLESGGALLGYICYGPTPMTESTWDLYWIVTDAAQRGRGVGRTLCAAMEAEVALAGARRIRVETSSTEGYGAAQHFYERVGYQVACRVPDFYREGDDLLILFKKL